MKSIQENISIREQQKILSSFNKFEISFAPDFSYLVNFSRKDFPIHRWFKYREGFSSLLVKHFIDPKDKLILDPFCGSGTTLVSAMEMKKNSIGIDVNPFSTFIAKIKTTKYTDKQIKQIEEVIPKLFHQHCLQQIDPPKLKIINKIFHPEILHYLLNLREKIETYDGVISNFLFFGWLSILERVSNTKKEGNGIKYRSTVRTKHGYVHIKDKEWQREHFGSDKLEFVKQQLMKQYTLMLDDVKLENYATNPAITRVFTSDNSDLNKHLSDIKVSKAIFSPPYANSFDYFEIFKVELWMGRFIESYEQLRQLRKQSIGSLWNYKTTTKTNIVELSRLFDLLDDNNLWDSKIKDMLFSYFVKMRQTITDIHKNLIDRGKCVIVVGNSAYGNVIIPTDLILSKIAQQEGFKNIKIMIARHLTTSSQQKIHLEPLKQYLRESILILEK